MSPIAPLDPADLDASRKAAMPAQGPLLPDCWRAQALLTPYGDSNPPLANYDQRLAELLARHPDGEIFNSFPGAGPALAPRLVAAFGADRERLDRADEMQCISGIAPVTKKSGKQHEVRRRWACNKFLRQTFHEFACHSLRFSAWARAYYDMMIQR